MSRERESRHTTWPLSERKRQAKPPLPRNQLLVINLISLRTLKGSLRTTKQHEQRTWRLAFSLSTEIQILSALEFGRDSRCSNWPHRSPWFLFTSWKKRDKLGRLTATNIAVKRMYLPDYPDIIPSAPSTLIHSQHLYPSPLSASREIRALSPIERAKKSRNTNTR